MNKKFIKTGKWIYKGSSIDGHKVFQCSECENNISGIGNYCKECGSYNKISCEKDNIENKENYKSKENDHQKEVDKLKQEIDELKKENYNIRNSNVNHDIYKKVRDERDKLIKLVEYFMQDILGANACYICKNFGTSKCEINGIPSRCDPKWNGKGMG